MSTELGRIEIAKIHVPEVKLREAKKDSVEFQELMTSLKNEGQLESIRVRPFYTEPEFDPETGEEIPGTRKKREGEYLLINGLQRYTAMKQLGEEFIDASIAEADDATALRQMLIANSHSIQTTRTEFSDLLCQILATDATMTVNELADLVSMSAPRVKKILDLQKLDDETRELVDNGEIIASNAYALSRLKEDQRAEFIDQAKTMESTEFNQVVMEQLKSNRQNNQRGKDQGIIEWRPRLKAQSFATLANEYRVANAVDEDTEPSELRGVLKNDFELDPTDETVAKVVAAVTSWAVNMHPSEYDRKVKEHEAKEKEKEEKKRRKEEEKKVQEEKEANQVVLGVK